MNDFSYLMDDVVGRLATIGCEEVFEKNLDEGEGFKDNEQHDKATV